MADQIELVLCFHWQPCECSRGCSKICTDIRKLDDLKLVGKRAYYGRTFGTWGEVKQPRRGDARKTIIKYITKAR